MNFITLPSKQQMPIIGLGTWQAEPIVVERAVAWAFDVGYRLIDTAYNYKNEEAIGRAIETWVRNGGKREELFIITKLPNFGNKASDVKKYLEESLKRLRLSYIDLYLIHHPFGFKEPPSGSDTPLLDEETDHLSIWKEMESAVRSGLVKNIGVSNFNKKQIERIALHAEIAPANVQVELHAFFQQPELVKTCKNLGITVTAYAPLGSPAAKSHFENKYNFQSNEVPDCLSEPLILAIAKKLNKTPAQIVLRFITQMGIAVVPKSSSQSRIRENFEALSFNLSEEDMKILKFLDKGEKGRIFDFLFYKGVEKHPEYPFGNKTFT